MQSLPGFLTAVATVALIVIATRWLVVAKGPSVPKTPKGDNVYGIKWQWQAAGYASAGFAMVLLVWSWHDLHSTSLGLISITLIFIALGASVASGSVTTNETGITKTYLWQTRHFLWSDITEVRLLKKDIGAVELRSGSRKMIIDSRFVAFPHLLGEMKNYTHLEPVQVP